MLTTALVLGWVLAGSPPLKDPCTLLTPAELQSLAPGANIASGVLTRVGEMALACEWKWGAGNGAQSLVVSHGENAKMWPNTELSVLTEGLMVQTKLPNATAVPVPGVGEAAIFDSTRPNKAEATAMMKKSNLTITLTGPDARAKKAQVISLLKAAVGRL